MEITTTLGKEGTALRTHTCEELRASQVGEEVSLCGWVQSRRDHGGVIFVDLRDRYGLTQAVFDPSHNKDVHAIAEGIRREYVLRVTGKVRSRKEGMINPRMVTGEVEIICDKLEILNESEMPPIEVDDNKPHTNEDFRLKYRYIDLRRPSMQQNLRLRHTVMKATRDYFDAQNFLEIETPMFIRSTPEGARDFVVPSRIHAGKMYALPQSPQLYKQLLMVSGCDRYFQLARCFRDEDSRKDRQPDFTQIDMEMSFVSQEDVFRVIEGLIVDIMKSVGKEVQIPFPRLTYKESMDRFGVDKPDLRFGMEIIDVAEAMKGVDFKVFADVLASNGWIRALNAKGCATYSRKDIDELTEFVKIYKAKGLAWMKCTEEGLESSVTKFFTPEQLKTIQETCGAEPGDLLLFVADKPKVVADALGNLRNELGKRLDLIPKDTYAYCWITDFPMFEWNEEENKWDAMHHLFTMPKKECLDKLETNPEEVIGDLYDLALNGVEMGSGSIRISRPEIQEKVLKTIGMSQEEAQEKFGFLMEAFKFGAPPHGGIALGLDRLVMILGGCPSIREVIAYPKNKFAHSPMDGSPAEIDDEQLKELHLKWNYVKKEKKDE